MDEGLSNLFDLSTHFIDGTITFYASWETVDATVSFSVLGEIIHADSVSSNGTVTFPEDPSLPFYLFDGWYADETFENHIQPTDVITEDMVLYAKFIYDTSRERLIDALFSDANLSEGQVGRLENVLVVDIVNLDGWIVAIITDFHDYLGIMGADNDDIEVGDLISLDIQYIVRYDDEEDYTELNAYFMDDVDITVESSNNPIVPLPVLSMEDILKQEEVRYPHYVHINGIVFYYDEALVIYNPENAHSFVIYHEGQIDAFDQPVHGEGIVYILSKYDRFSVNSVNMGGFDFTTISDEDTLAGLKEFALKYFEDRAYKPETSFRLPFDRHMVEYVTITTQVKEGYEQYYNQTTNRFLFTFEPTDVVFEMTLERNDTVITFDFSVTLETTEVLSIAEVLARYEERNQNIILEAMVLVDAEDGVLLYDGEDIVYMGNYYNYNFVPGETYVLSVSTNNIYESFISGYRDILKELGPSDLSFPECECTMEDIANDSGLLPAIVTVEGTLGEETLNWGTRLYLDTGTEIVYLSYILADYKQYLIENHLGETIELDLLIHDYRENADGSFDYVSAVLNEDSYKKND